MTDFTAESESRPALERVIVQRSAAAGAVGPLETPPACRLMRSVRLLEQYISVDGRRALYVLEAPDAELVRELVRLALPAGEDVRVWTVGHVR